MSSYEERAELNCSKMLTGDYESIKRCSWSLVELAKEADTQLAECEKLFAVHDHKVTNLESQLAEKDKEIEWLKKSVNDLIFSMKYATDYLDESTLNSIGYASKAHNQMLFALKMIPKQALREQFGNIEQLKADAIEEMLDAIELHTARYRVEGVFDNYCYESSLKSHDILTYADNLLKNTEG